MIKEKITGQFSDPRIISRTFIIRASTLHVGGVATMFLRDRFFYSSSKFVAILLTYTIIVGTTPSSVRADTLSNNTVKLLSDNQIIVKDNLFYTPVTISNTIELSGGIWGTIATSAFSIILGQLGKDDSKNRFDSMDRQLAQLRALAEQANAKLDHMDLVLREIADQNDEILRQVEAVPARQAFYTVLADISNIQNSWHTWTNTRVAESKHASEMKSAYEGLRKDAAVLYVQKDPTYTPILALALRLDIDLAHKLNLSGDDVADLKKGYRDFLNAALAPTSPIKPGEQVNATDSFATRLAKRRALIAIYLGDEYKLNGINFGSNGNCVHPLSFTSVYSDEFSDTSVKDSFIWDPPPDPTIVLRLIRANALSIFQGPVDKRLVNVQKGNTSNAAEQISEIGRSNDSFWMSGSWDLVVAAKSADTKFEYVGAYYRPSRLDNCEPGTQRGIPRLGVLSGGELPKSAEDFFKKYGQITDHELDIYAKERIAQANVQLQLLATEAIAFADTSELRQALDRL